MISQPQPSFQVANNRMNSMKPMTDNLPPTPPPGPSTDTQQLDAVKAELEMQRNYLRDILDSVEDAFMSVTPDGKLIFASRSFEQVFGYPVERYLSDPDFYKTVVHPDDLALVIRQRDDLFDKGSVELERRLVFPDGSIHWQFQRIWVNYDAQGQPLTVNTMGRDITARKQAEAALREAAATLEQRVDERTAELNQIKHRLETIFETISDGVLLLDPVHGIQAANPAGEALLNITPADYATFRLEHIFAPETVVRLRALKLQVAQTRQPQQVEAVLQRPGGLSHDVEISYAPVSGDESELAQLVIIIRDVTARKRTEAALRASEARYLNVVQTQTELICRYDTDLKLTFVNDAYARRFDQLPRDLVGQSFLPLIPERERDAVRLHALDLLRNGGASVHEYEFSGADGQKYWQYWTDVALYDDHGTIAGVQAVGVDITERKRAEMTLQQKLDQEQELQQNLQVLHAISIELTKVETLDEFYRAVVEMGLTRLGMDRVGIFLYDQAANMAQGVYGTDDVGNIQAEKYIRFLIRPDGGMYTSMIKPERFHFNDNAPLYHKEDVVGYGWNLTVALWSGDRVLGWLVADNYIHRRPVTPTQIEILAQYGIYVSASLVRRQVEDALRASEEEFRLLLEAAPVATIISDTLGMIALVNQAAEDMFGYSRAEMLGQPLEIIMPQALDETDLPLSPVIAGADDERERLNVMALVGRRKNGTRFPADIQLSYIEIQSSSVMMLHVLDMTQRAAAEKALKQALAREKELSELRARFVSTTSHEFRTPLAAILAATESLSLYRQRMDDEQIANRLERIRAQVLHMRNIMEDVLQLTKMEAGYADFKLTDGDLGALCQAIVDEFNSQPDYHDRLVFSTPLAEPTAQFDARLLRQVVTNLVHNGLKYSEKQVRVELDRDEDELILKISDQGIGIPADDLKRLFEPFHRAANVGTISGTGLGLSIAKQAVTLHKGSLSVASQVGVGTTFTVRVPIKA